MSRQFGRADDGGGEETGIGRLAFIDHARQRYAVKVRLPNEGEILVGDHLAEGEGVGALGEFRIVLHDLGDRRGRLHPQLCLFGDGVGALDTLVEAAQGSLSTVLAPVAGHEELSRRLATLGLRDASDAPLTEAA
jgi:hypothetical protein